MDTSFDVQPAAVLLVHSIHKQITVRVGIFEGRLKTEAQVLVKPTSFEIGGRDNPGYSLAAELDERIVEAKPQVFTAKPCATWSRCDVHQKVCTVEVLIEDTSNQTPAFVNQANGRTPAGRPSTAGPGTNPRADDIVLTDENFLQSTPPIS